MIIYFKKVFVEKKTPLGITIAATLLTAFLGIWGIRNGCTANETASKSFKINEEIYKAREIPRLVVSPLNVQFYTPEKPQVPGQEKIDISAVFENLSDVPAREISLNFETEDWFGHPTSLFQIYREQKAPIPHIFSLPKGQKLVYPSYAPDIPAAGESGFIQQNKPFRLKLVLHWKDVNDRKYVYVGFYTLKPSPWGDRHLFYFQPLNAYDSVKDDDTAWKYATEGVWEGSG